MPRLDRLSLTTSSTTPQGLPPKDEISPVDPLEPPAIVIEDETGDRGRISPRPSSRGCTTPPDKRQHCSRPADDDIHSLDDEGWARVAKAQGIEELLVLGEGVSGSVSKCRLRKSGQVFAIKVFAAGGGTYA